MTLLGRQASARVHHPWATLTRASHHQVYELPPKAGELQAAFEVVAELGERT